MTIWAISVQRYKKKRTIPNKSSKTSLFCTLFLVFLSSYRTKNIVHFTVFLRYSYTNIPFIYRICTVYLPCIYRISTVVDSGKIRLRYKGFIIKISRSVNSAIYTNKCTANLSKDGAKVYIVLCVVCMFGRLDNYSILT